MLSLLNKRWSLATPDPAWIGKLQTGLDVSPLVATLLTNRGALSIEEAGYLINPDLANTHDPYLMLGMRQAVDRILQSIESGDAITVFGDYDVDGVTSAAFMTHFFRDLGVPHAHYLPNRMDEGYGLSKGAVEKIKSRGSGLMITADCGITAVDEVDYAKELGLDVIVTDHHQIGERGLPKSVAVLNPHQPGCSYPYKFLSGVGVVFKLAVAIRSALLEAGWEKSRLPRLKNHLDLFVLGTIADVAPLSGENHILVRHGLEVMSSSLKPGLAALKAVAGVNGEVDARSVAFTLGPRLNAAGRLGKADAGLHLLTATDPAEALKLAQGLEQVNKERQEVQKWTQEEADYLMEREVDLERDKVIVLASESFHKGVIGIVAARLAQTHYRPTVLIALENGAGKGSARSIPAFNLFKAFQECSEFLDQFGGHAYAAGLNIQEDNVEKFRAAINRVGDRFLNEDAMIQTVEIDAALELPDLTLEFYRDMAALEPYGQGNRLPVFLTRGATVRNLRRMGKDQKHARFNVGQGSASVEAVAFYMNQVFEGLDTDAETFDLVYELQINDWSGREKLQLKILDVRPHLPEE